MYSFDQKCYSALVQIPKGRVVTYSILAKWIGHPKAYRAVGNAMSKNDNAPLIPCHRVVKSNGEIGGYAKGSNVKVQLLEAEGIRIKNKKVVNLVKYLFKP